MSGMVMVLILFSKDPIAVDVILFSAFILILQIALEETRSLHLST